MVAGAGFVPKRTINPLNFISLFFILMPSNTFCCITKLSQIYMIFKSMSK